MDNNIPSKPAYGVFISQLIRYMYLRVCGNYQHFVYRSVQITTRLQRQGFDHVVLCNTFKKFLPLHCASISGAIGKWLGIVFVFRYVFFLQKIGTLLYVEFPNQHTSLSLTPLPLSLSPTLSYAHILFLFFVCLFVCFCGYFAFLFLFVSFLCHWLSWERVVMESPR